MTRETFWDRWAPDHPVQWTPISDEPPAYLSIEDAVSRIDRTMDLGGNRAFIERMLRDSRRIIGAFATYELVTSEVTA